MHVELIAATAVRADAFSYLSQEACSTDSEYLIEFAGRACYQSWDRPNPATARTRDYVKKNIIGKDHQSVLEHASATFYLTGVSRSLTHELIRHRHLSFSELSQRYVDMNTASPVVPPEAERYRGEIEHGHAMAVADYKELHDALAADDGLPRKRARQAARCRLPEGTETRMVVTGNYRAWRHVIAQRGSEHADAEICELAITLLELLYDEAPSVFGDFSIVDLPDGRRVIE